MVLVSMQIFNDREEVISYISSLQPVLGRGEFLDFGQNYQIVLDYAHTTNGILNILQTLKRRKHHRIITVIGSAGGREKEKRGSISCGSSSICLD